MEETTADAGDDDAYGGVLGAYPYAFRASDSRLFRLYVVVGGVVTLLLGIGFAISLLGVVANTAGAGGGTFSFVRAFVITVGLVVVFPLVVPVILAARRHRRDRGTMAYDYALAAAGFVYTLSLYLAALVSAPADLRDPPAGLFAPVFELLYGLPRLAALIFPVAAVVLMYLAHRRLS